MIDLFKIGSIVKEMDQSAPQIYETREIKSSTKERKNKKKKNKKKFSTYQDEIFTFSFELLKMPKRNNEGGRTRIEKLNQN